MNRIRAHTLSKLETLPSPAYEPSIQCLPWSQDPSLMAMNQTSVDTSQMYGFPPSPFVMEQYDRLTDASLSHQPLETVSWNMSASAPLPLMESMFTFDVS